MKEYFSSKSIDFINIAFDEQLSSSQVSTSMVNHCIYLQLMVEHCSNLFCKSIRQSRYGEMPALFCKLYAVSKMELLNPFLKILWIVPNRTDQYFHCLSVWWYHNATDEASFQRDGISFNDIQQRRLSCEVVGRKSASGNILDGARSERGPQTLGQWVDCNGWRILDLESECTW